MKKIICFIIVLTMVISMFTTINGETDLTDVKSTDWFYDNVEEMIKLGMVKGYSDNTFKPQNSVKADEFIKMLIIGMGYTTTPTDSLYWADEFITKAEELKIVDKTFINDYRYNLTREQASKIIVNALSLKENRPSNSYAAHIKNVIYDYHLIADKYKQDMIDCYAWGIMQGNTKGEVKPKDTITRAETTAVILRMMNKDRRLDLNFKEVKQITIFDAYSDGNKSDTIIAPIFNGKALDDIIDVALIMQKQLGISKGGDILGVNEEKLIMFDGFGTQEQLGYVITTGKKSFGEISFEEVNKVAYYYDFSFSIDTLNLSGKYKPYDLSLWKKIIYEELGYATYYDYFIAMYKQPFEEIFKYLFEDDYAKAWVYFTNALKYEKQEVKIEKYVLNERHFQINYASDGVGFCISLKGQYK